MAQGETVCLVCAQEIRWFSLDKWHVRTLWSAAVQQTTVDAFQVHDARMLAQVVGRVDSLQPLPNQSKSKIKKKKKKQL